MAGVDVCQREAEFQRSHTSSGKSYAGLLSGPTVHRAGDVRGPPGRPHWLGSG